jgi:hypothetical protein
MKITWLQLNKSPSRVNRCAARRFRSVDFIDNAIESIRKNHPTTGEVS